MPDTQGALELISRGKEKTGSIITLASGNNILIVQKAE